MRIVEELEQRRSRVRNILTSSFEYGAFALVYQVEISILMLSFRITLTGVISIMY